MKKQNPSSNIARETLTGLVMTLVVGVVSAVALSALVLMLVSR